MRVTLKYFLPLSIALATLGFLQLSLQASTPSITISPGTTIVGVGQSIQYQAKVTGLSNTVKWEVDDIPGGSTTTGTISASGLYEAPSKLTATTDNLTITALGSDGKTKANVALSVEEIGPTIQSVNPNPIYPGRYNITIHGKGFESGATVRNGTTQLNTTFVNSTQLKASGNQATTATGVFQVRNSDTVWGPKYKVQFNIHGAAPTITPLAITVHLGQTSMFVAPGATYLTASEGFIYQTGFFVAPSKMPASKTVKITATGQGGSASAVVTLVDGADQTISPKTANVAVGGTQQFTSSGAKVWTAQFGAISSTGLYTAPSVWPEGGAEEISVNGDHGSATEKFYIAAPLPEITAVSNGGHLPLGTFSITVTGKNFSPNSNVEIRGLGLARTYSNGALKVTGFFNQPGLANLIVSNQNLASQPFPIQIGVATPKVSPAAARRFLEQGAFGPTPNEAENLQGLGFQGWLNNQYKIGQVSNYTNVSTFAGGMPEQFLTNAVENPDQLRQRVAFALSELFVTSLATISNKNMISYQDMLLAGAFTNYRKIMEDVTLSPAMGQYLNIANNAKADPVAGTLANENYAREMMQLFTIGTTMLNEDGTVQLDLNGLSIPTYSQFTVTEFARVYTGWTYAPKSGKSVQWYAGVNDNGPLAAYAQEHDSGSKQLLNGYVAPAGLTPKADLEGALDNIFNHPNVGPFVSAQLIQHLVKSNPSPAYVSRVAAAFNNNGSGVRGDMKAVISAILLDPEARANDEGGNDQVADGHLQEPALFIAGMVRAFGGQMNDKNYYHWELQNMGQDVFSAPSVFSFFSPTYNVPGTNLTGGEFQIQSPNNAVVRANEVSVLFNQWANPVQTFGPGTTVDTTPYVNLAGNPDQLVAALDLTLTHGTMPAAMKEAIVTAVQGETGGNLRRVERASYLILTSNYYNVWH